MPNLMACWLLSNLDTLWYGLAAIRFLFFCCRFALCCDTLLLVFLIESIVSYKPWQVKYNRTMNEAILYILYSPVHKAIKIGISDISGKRFASHRTKGWMLVSYWHFFSRDKARAVETIVLNTLRQKHGHFLNKEDMPQNGYTETFAANKVTKKGLIRMVNKAIKGVS